MEDIVTVGRLRELHLLEKIAPDLSWHDFEQVLQGRRFNRWYAKNKKAVDMLSFAAPVFTMTLFNVPPTFLLGNLAIPAAGFFSGHGVILLHMLIAGFLTLVVTTFLKFTGRGDIAPLVMFVGGGVILYETLGLFKDIYYSVANFFKL